METSVVKAYASLLDLQPDLEDYCTIAKSDYIDIICKVCTFIAIVPVECQKCHNVFCEKCSKRFGKGCVLKCGGNLTQPNFIQKKYKA